jgi:hypothetical protein
MSFGEVDVVFYLERKKGTGTTGVTRALPAAEPAASTGEDTAEQRALEKRSDPEVRQASRRS